MKIVQYDPTMPTLHTDGTVTAGATVERRHVLTATEAARKYNSALRLEVFSHYCGGAPHCQCPGCKTDFIEFLTLDHINGDGAAHRKENKLGTGGPRLWRWVREHGYPEGFQVLCQNCNHAKFTRPACPLAGEVH